MEILEAKIKTKIKYIKNPNYRRWFVRKVLGRKNWKYKLTEDYYVYVGIRVPRIVNIKNVDMFIDTKFITLVRGWLIIQKGYCWDGPSGPAIDTKDFMRASLIHDALYWLMREGLLDIKYRKAVDKLLRKICIEDGMWRIRAFWVYMAVRMFGKKYAKKA